MLRTLTYNPTGNSTSERLNQTILRVLKTNQNSNILEVLRKAEKTLNWNYHYALGMSPYEKVHGRSPFWTDTIENRKEKSKNMEQVYKDYETRMNRGKHRIIINRARWFTIRYQSDNLS